MEIPGKAHGWSDVKNINKNPRSATERGFLLDVVWDHLFVVDGGLLDGSQAHLYFDPTNKNCQAYGISAYIVTQRRIVVKSLHPDLGNQILTKEQFFLLCLRDQV